VTLLPVAHRLSDRALLGRFEVDEQTHRVGGLLRAVAQTLDLLAVAVRQKVVEVAETPSTTRSSSRASASGIATTSRTTHDDAAETLHNLSVTVPYRKLGRTCRLVSSANATLRSAESDRYSSGAPTTVVSSSFARPTSLSWLVCRAWVSAQRRAADFERRSTLSGQWRQSAIQGATPSG